MTELKRLELNSEIKLAYSKVKRDLGENFDDHMRNLTEEIVGLQKKSKVRISFYIAGILLAMPPDGESNINEETNDDYAFYSMMVKAAIGWGLLNGHCDPNNPFLDELREE